MSNFLHKKMILSKYFLCRNKIKMQFRNAIFHMRNESGQMAVELAVIMPVVIIAMVIIIDGIVFVSECSRFDHAANNAILACGVSMSGSEYRQDEATAAVINTLKEDFTFGQEEVEVEANSKGVLSDLVSYDCTLKIAPWPLNANSLYVFGVTVPTSLVHTRSFVVRPYAPGRL